MPSRANHYALVITFTLAGFFVPPFFAIFGSGWIFYTTKPAAFLDDWHILVFEGLFGFSIGLIPLAAWITRRFDNGPGFGKVALILTSAWLVSVFVSSLLVRFITATVHHATLNIPDGLLPVGLLFIPSVAIATVLFMGFMRVRRHKHS